MENQEERKPRRRRERGERGDRGDRRGRGHREEEKSEKIEELIRQIKEELCDSIEPISLTDLNAFERRQIHRQFDRSTEIATKTYRVGEDAHELRIYPVGNLRRFAQKMADRAVETREKVVLPHMSSYERFVVHEYLKTLDTVKTCSHGEGDDRHIEIEPEVFGRGLKKLIRKIRLR